MFDPQCAEVLRTVASWDAAVTVEDLRARDRRRFATFGIAPPPAVADVRVKHLSCDGMMHGFLSHGRAIERARSAVEELGAAVRATLAVPAVK